MRKSRPTQNPVPYYIPTAQPVASGTIITHKPLNDMTPQESIAYLTSLKQRLENRKQRDRRYLDRPYRKANPTSTDELMEQDQGLFSEIMTLLDMLATELTKEETQP